MASHKSISSKYISEFSPPGPGNEVYCTGAQLLSEKMCKRIAARQKRHIGFKFWNDPAWLKEFKKQLSHASKLIKELESEGITNAVDIVIKSFREKELNKVFSLGLKSVIKPVCLKVFYKDSLTAQSPPPTIDGVDVTQKPRPPAGVKSLKSKLQDLET